MLRTILIVLFICIVEILANSLNRKFTQENQLQDNHLQRVKRNIIPNGGKKLAGLPRTGKRLVCYWGSWSYYRWGVANFPPESINPNLCTHAIYGFAKLGDDGTLTPYDSWLDLGDSSPGSGLKGYQRFMNLTLINPNLITLIAIGGWNDGSEKYSAMVSSSAARQTFVQSVLSFLDTYKFDGLDLDWEYPASRGGAASDRENFISLVQELRAAFVPNNYLLSAAVSPGSDTMAIAYDIPNMCANLNFINVMSYDYHGGWDNVTGENSPLYYKQGDQYPDYNVNTTIQLYIKGGCPLEKLNMGMPLYGRSFTLADPSNYGLGAPASGPGTAGTYTQEAGYFAYYEVCYKILTETWTPYWDDTAKTPYIVNGNQWVGFDDVTSIGYKANYVMAQGLGGGMVWAIDLDDFSNRCGGGVYPLLTTIYTVLNGGAAPTEAPTTTTTAAPTTTTSSTTTTSTTTVAPTTTSSTTTVAPTSTSTASSTTQSTTTAGSTTSSSTTAGSSTTTATSTTTSSPTTTTSSTTTTTPSTTTVDSAPSEFVCEAEGYFVDPNDCNIFYRCVANGAGGYVKYTQRCAANLVFDQSSNSCNYRSSSVTGC